MNLQMPKWREVNGILASPPLPWCPGDALSIPADWGDLVGDSRWSTLHSQAGTRREGECGLRGRFDVPDHGCTIFYLPFILPVLLPGVEVNPWDIAKSLIVTMLVPLVIGMLIKSHSPDVADHWAPVMQKISSLSILILLVVGLGLNISNIIGFIGTRGIGAMVILILGALLIGLLFGGRDPGVRSALGLSTANRNGAAALLVATQNFSGTNTLPFVLVGTVLMLLILLPFAKRMGARSVVAKIEPTE